MSKDTLKIESFHLSKRVLAVLVVCLLLIAVCFGACSTDAPREGTYSRVEFTMTPSPPRQKIVTGNDDIRSILNFIEAIDKKDAADSGDSINGWTAKIDFIGKKTHTVSFIGDRMRYDDRIYLIDTAVTEHLQDLYSSMNYPEKLLE